MRLLAYLMALPAFVALGLAAALVAAALLTAGFVARLLWAALLHFFWPRPRRSAPWLVVLAQQGGTVA